MTIPQPDSPEVDKILHRLGDIGVTWFGGIDEGVAEAKQAIHEYYTNKFLEALPTLDTIISKEYNDGFADAIMKVRTAIKQLSKDTP